MFPGLLCLLLLEIISWNITPNHSSFDFFILLHFISPFIAFNLFFPPILHHSHLVFIQILWKTRGTFKLNMAFKRTTSGWFRGDAGGAEVTVGLDHPEGLFPPR